MLSKPMKPQGGKAKNTHRHRAYSKPNTSPLGRCRSTGRNLSSIHLILVLLQCGLQSIPIPSMGMHFSISTSTCHTERCNQMVGRKVPWRKSAVYSPGSCVIFLNGFGFHSTLFVTFLQEKSRGTEMKQIVQNF